MYIQITSKCNMHCAHCGYSCDSNGQHMSMSTFRKAIAYAEERGEYVCLGGGEPTTHPHFYEILVRGMAASYDGGLLCIITNGKLKKKALLLAKLDRAGKIHAELSRDEFHEGIDPEVVGAFGTYRDTSHNVIAVGRAENWGWSDACICDDLFVDPAGRIWACGCQKEQFGTVDNPQIPDDYYDRSCQCSTEHAEELETTEERAEA